MPANRKYAAKKKSKVNDIPGLRRKRQIEGQRNDEVLLVYLSPEEKAVIKAAAKKVGMSVSSYCMSITLAKAKTDLGE